jgi:putative nucleotidyltransferase with HDIG domain
VSTTETTRSLRDLDPRDLRGFVEDIPPLPVIYRGLFARMQDPDTALPEIARIITRDPSLSTGILHLVNNGFTDPGWRIRTISRAMVILGFRAVQCAALATGVCDHFAGDQDGSADRLDFWRHSIAVATIGKILAEDLDIIPREEAFVAGLLHDIGKLVEKRHFDRDFRELGAVARERHLSWIESEKALFRTDHADIGKTVLRAWGCPPSVTDAVEFHHNPARSAKLPRLTALVHVADIVSYEIGLGAPGAGPPGDGDTGALKMLGITMPQTRAYHDRIRAELEGSMEILKLVD